MSFEAIYNIAQAEAEGKAAVAAAEQKAKAMIAEAESEGKASVQAAIAKADEELKALHVKSAEKENAAAEVYGVLCRTVLRLLAAAAEKTGVGDALLFGGVISSALLREMLLDRNEKRRIGLKLHFGRKEYSGDNAVGVALIGLQRLEKEKAHGDSDGR